MLETVASILVFTLTVVSVSLAAAAALRSQRTGLVERQGAETLGALVDQVITQPYTSFLDDSFVLPSPCAGSSTGSSGTSCVTILSEDVVVSWSITPTTDPLGISTVAASATVVTASTSVTGRSISASRTLNAPSFGFSEGAAVIRVATDTPPPDGTPVFLLDDSEPRQVVDAVSFSAAGVALFRVDPSACTDDAPCVVSLASHAVAPVDGLFLDGPAARRGVSLTSASMLQVPVVLRSQARIELAVIAENIDGEVASNPTAGSVCAWVSFRDSGGAQIAPACNTTSPDRLIFDTYRVDTARADLYPVPAGVALSVSLDHPDGTCPLADGMVASVDGEWVAAAACSSWTWGHPQDLTIDSTMAVPTPEFTLTAGTSRGTIRWAGADAIPASGFAGEPLWSKPRNTGSCADTQECTPAPQPAPETVSCPGEHCNSTVNVAPFVEVGDYAAAPQSVQLTATTTAFTISVNDLESDTVSVEVVTVPSTGVLTTGDPATEVGAGDTLLTNVAAGSEVSFSYSRSTPESNEFLTLLLTDSEGNTRTTAVALVSSATLRLVHVSTTQIAQNSSGSLYLSGWDTDGEPSADTVSIVYSTGLGGPAEATFVDGAATIAITVTDALAGAQYVYLTSSAGQLQTAEIEVVAAPSALVVDVDDLPQAGTTPVEVTVTDANGLPIPTTQIRLALTGPEGGSLGLRLLPGACRTGVAGTCTVDVLAEDVAPLGTFSVTASAGSLLGTASASIVPALSTFTAEPLVVAQGGQSTLTIVSRDGAGDTFPQVAVSIAAPAGITVNPQTSTTDLDGVLEVVVSAAATASQGRTVLTATSGTVSVDIPITVTATVASFTTSTLTLAPGTSGVLEVAVVDANGSPVAGAVAAASASQLRVDPSGVSSSAGVVSLPVVAPAGVASGSYVISVEIAGVTADVEVTVS